MAPASFSDARHWWREPEGDQGTGKLQKAVLRKQPLVDVHLHMSTFGVIKCLSEAALLPLFPAESNLEEVTSHSHAQFILPFLYQWLLALPFQMVKVLVVIFCKLSLAAGREEVAVSEPW